MYTPTAPTPAPQTRPSPTTAQLSSSARMQECIDRCLACQRSCIMLLTHLRDLGGAHLDPTRVRSLLDCADACQVAATFMMRGSARHVEMCAVVARICRDAAERCEGTNVEQIRKCVDAARTCESSCRELISTRAEAGEAVK